MHKSFIAASALLLVGATAFAAPAAPKAKTVAKKAAPVAASLVCPITGEKIASVKAAAGSSTYKGKTYYFCCASCKPAFDKNPAKFAKADVAKPSHKM